jgi:hypothetical protein
MTELGPVAADPKFPLIPSQVLEDLKNLEADGIKPSILAEIIGEEIHKPENGTL